MQKISSYLYSNRILVVANLASLLVEYRPVYQRRLKLYKGVKNVVEFDVRNADQKRISITNYDLKCVILDNNNTEVLTLDVEPISNTTGLAKMTVYAEQINYIKPQFLKFSLYILNNDGTKTLLYGDSQFGATGTIDLLNGVVPEAMPAQIIDKFIYLIDDSVDPEVTTHYSSAVEINPRNDINDTHQIRLEFRLIEFDAEVTVQITTDAVVSSATDWSDLETFSINPSTDVVSKVYNEITDYSNNVNWLRVTYIQDTTNTGSIDKILVLS